MCIGTNSLLGLIFSYSGVLADFTSFSNITTCTGFNTTAMVNSNCKIFNTASVCISCAIGYNLQSNTTCLQKCTNSTAVVSTVSAGYFCVCPVVTD